MILCFILLFLNSTWSKAYDSIFSSEEEVISMEQPNVVIPVLPLIPMDLKGTIRRNSAWVLFKLPATPGEHVVNNVKVCSPVAMLLPLGKLLFGTKSDSPTETELLRAMGISSAENANNAIKKSLTDLRDLESIDMDMASRLYLSKTKTVSKAYLKKTQTIYNYSIDALNFERPDESADAINKWLSDVSQKQFIHTLSHNMIKADDSLVLVNAVRLKGRWQIAFDKEKVEVFYNLEGRASAAPAISTHAYFNYVQSSELNAQIVEMPYAGGEATMVIVLPFHRYGLPILTNTLKISPTLLNTAIMKMTVTLVEVMIPKFKAESTINLKNFYHLLNLTNILKTSGSDISKIVKGEHMYISNAVCKTIFEIDGDGAEISTAVSETEHGVKPVTIFYADHPFLFYIKANKDQLLTGLYLSP